MKHLALFILILFCLVPVMAQDAEATVEAMPVVIVADDSAGGDANNSIPTPVVAVGALILGVVILGLMYNQAAVLKIVAPLIPVESATALVTAALPSIKDVVMNNVASKIPGQIDDMVFIEAAKSRGLSVVRDDITGIYHSTRIIPPPASSLSSTGADYTSTTPPMPGR